MTGRAEVARQKKRLDAVFDRASIISGDAELLSDFARYLCVLVAGFLEQAMIELVLEYVRTHSHESVVRYVEGNLRRWTSASSQRISELLGGLDAEWRIDLEGYLVDEYKDAVDSIVNQRHLISHGRYTGITMHGVKEYYERVSRVVDHVADLCTPV
jgi:hypothetical protein